MFYEFDLTIPANTLEASPAEVEAVMTTGIINQVEVQLPSGLRGLVHTAAWRALHQVWPSNPDGSIKGNGARIVWGENYDLTQPPYVITLRGWSPDTCFSHVVTWRFSMGPGPVKEAKEPAKKKGILSALTHKGAS